MENVFIVNAIGTKESSTTASIEGLAAREVLVIGTNNVVLATPADCVGVDGFYFVTKLTSGKFRTSAVIKRRNVTSIKKKDYVAFTLPQWRLASGSNGLNVETTGEAQIGITNKSYNRTINYQRVNVNVVKLAGESTATYLAKVVAALNAENSKLSQTLFTATLGNTSSNYFITIASTNRNADISITMDGMFAGTEITNTVVAVTGNGFGADIVALEKDHSKNLGNQGYERLTEAWYNAPTESLATENYDILNLAWKGESPTASSSMTVASNTITLGFPTGGTVIDNVETLLRYLSGDTYIDETPIEP
jgi:hypothetical protein